MNDAIALNFSTLHFQLSILIRIFVLGKGRFAVLVTTMVLSGECPCRNFSGKSAKDGTIKTLQGWMDCMPGTTLKGVVYGTSALAPGAVNRNTRVLDEAYDLGKHSLT